MPNSPALADIASFQFLTEPLDARTKMYIEARARGSTPVAAARVAGFKDPDASSFDLERDLNIRAAIESLVRIQSRNLEIGRKDIVDGLMDAVRAASCSAELTHAWIAIARVTGALEPESRTEHDVSEQRARIAELTDEELARKASVEGDYKVIDLPLPKRP
jgi:hypothetical protein